MQKEWLLRNHELGQQLEEMRSNLEKSNLAIEGTICDSFISLLNLLNLILCLELKAQKEAELSKKDATIADQVRKMEHIRYISYLFILFHFMFILS
jgi:hypothetical protein